jgi:hypothetical protein
MYQNLLRRKVSLSNSFFLCCYVKGYDGDCLSFCVGKMVVPSSASASKGSSGKDVCLAKPSLLGKPSPDVEDILAHRTDVLDIALASRHGGAISRDTVCGLLTKCLQDVSCAIDVMFCLFVLLLDFRFFFVPVLGYEINYH